MRFFDRLRENPHQTPHLQGLRAASTAPGVLWRRLCEPDNLDAAFAWLSAERELLPPASDL